MASDFKKLNLSDLTKGVITAFLAAALTAVYGIISNGGLPNKAELLNALQVGVTSAVAYILKNLFTNNEGKFLKKDV